MSGTAIGAELQTVRAEFRKFVWAELNHSYETYFVLEECNVKYRHGEVEKGHPPRQKQKQKQRKRTLKCALFLDPMQPHPYEALIFCSVSLPEQSSEKHPGGVQACWIPPVSSLQDTDLQCLQCKPICLSMVVCVLHQALFQHIGETNNFGHFGYAWWDLLFWDNKEKVIIHRKVLSVFLFHCKPEWLSFICGT